VRVRVGVDVGVDADVDVPVGVDVRVGVGVDVATDVAGTVPVAGAVFVGVATAVAGVGVAVDVAVGGIGWQSMLSRSGPSSCCVTDPLSMTSDSESLWMIVSVPSAAQLKDDVKTVPVYVEDGALTPVLQPAFTLTPGLACGASIAQSGHSGPMLVVSSLEVTPVYATVTDSAS
jgi:hypothetical protein